MRTLVLTLGCLVALPGLARAEPKKTLAINVDGKEPESGKTAEVVATTLRTLASAKKARYQLQGTRPQVIQTIRDLECTSTELACAAAVGAKLGVDYMLVGQVETRGTHRVIVVGLVNVQTKLRVRSLRDTVSTAFDAKAWARRVFQRIVSTETGELTVRVNAKRGDVVIDGEVVAALFDGRTTLSGIAIGTHQLGIRAPGYRSIDVEIEVEGTSTETLLLESAP